MGLLDSIIGAAAGNTSSGEAYPLLGMIGGLIAENGGLQGLAGKFAQAGHAGAFSSWVGTGANTPISAEAIQTVLGSRQINALAAKLGIDPAQASNFLAEHLPQIVDKLTPSGAIDPAADHKQGLAELLPTLLGTLRGGAGAQG